jgi:hypothetical protein
VLRAILNAVERRRRPMHDHHYLVLSGIGLAYGRCPNAASESLRLALLALNARQSVCEETATPPHVRYTTGTLANWTDGMTLLSARQLERLHPRALIFAAIRDPITRLAACYARDFGRGRNAPASSRFLGFQKGMSFDAFAAWVCGIPDRKSPNSFRGQADILLHKGRLLPQHLIRFESRQADWEALRAKVKAKSGIDIGPLLEADDTSESEISALAKTLEPALRKPVKQRYRRDYELLIRQDAAR